MAKDSRSLLLITVVKNLQKLGYVFKVKCTCFSVDNFLMICSYLYTFFRPLHGSKFCPFLMYVYDVTYSKKEKQEGKKKKPCIFFCILKHFQQLQNLCTLILAIWQIYAVQSGNSHSLWEQIAGQISILGQEQYSLIDWSMYVSFTLSLGIMLLLFSPCRTWSYLVNYLLVFYLFLVDFSWMINILCILLNSFDGIIADSLEAKEAISRWVGLCSWYS